MSEARLIILNMLSEKKISIEEAERLLKALETESKAKPFSNVFKEIGQSLQNIPRSDAAQVVSEAFEHVKNTVSSVGSILDGTDQDQQLQIGPGTDLKVNHGGGNLLLHTIEGEELILSGARRGCSMDSEQNSVTVNSGGGNLAVGIPANVQMLSINTGGGNVSVRGLSVQQLHARSAGGNLSAEGMHAGEAKISSMGGHVSLKELQTNSLEARSIGGNVDVSIQPTKEGVIDLHSVGGNVDLKLPEDASFSVTADTLGGKFSTEFELEDYRSHGGKAEGRTGSDGLTIRLRTKGGNARVRKLG